jgi:Domain of unknown function (DUF4352)
VSADEPEPPVVRRSLAIILTGVAFALGVVITSAIAALIDGSDNSRSTSSSTSTLPVQLSLVPPGPRTTTYVPPSGGIGQPVVNGGVKLTVNSVSSPPVISRHYKGDVSPRAGAKYVQVETLVENAGQKSMDLTCGYPLANKVYDTQKRQYDAVDDLYELPGNPGCNDSLQPGFSSPMTYVYEVPQGAVIEFFGFADSDANYGANLSFITISA